MQTKNYYTRKEYESAKSANIADFLQSIGYELVRYNSCYKGKLHDSLVIHDDNRYFWNSQGLSGHSPIELYTHILLNDYGYTNKKEAYIAAVKQLAGVSSENIVPASLPTLARPPNIPLLLPTPYINNKRVIAYLCGTRKLDYEIVSELLHEKKIYEDERHNAIFIAYDRENRPQNAFMRGTLSDVPFKRNIDLSDKSYPFTLSGYDNSDSVICFEGCCDCIAHASIYKNNGLDWRTSHRISLDGVSCAGLERFLRENPQVTKVSVALDNDPTGNRAADRIMKELENKGYEVERELSQYKDFNVDLTKYNDDFEQEWEVY